MLCFTLIKKGKIPSDSTSLSDAVPCCCSSKSCPNSLYPALLFPVHFKPTPCKQSFHTWMKLILSKSPITFIFLNPTVNSYPASYLTHQQYLALLTPPSLIPSFSLIHPVWYSKHYTLLISSYHAVLFSSGLLFLFLLSAWPLEIEVFQDSVLDPLLRLHSPHWWFYIVSWKYLYANKFQIYTCSPYLSFESKLIFQILIHFHLGI